MKRDAKAIWELLTACIGVYLAYSRSTPYMHDGRFATLEEVLDFYSSGTQAGRTTDPLIAIAAQERDGAPFTREEKDALIAFLKTMSDPDFLESIQAP